MDYGYSLCSTSDLGLRPQHEYAFITHIQVTRVSSGLRRIPEGFYVSVDIDGKTMRTTNKLASVDNVVEWDEQFGLPPERSSTIFFKLYASSGLRPGYGEVEFLRQFKTTVGNLLDCDEELQPVRCLDGRVSPSSSSLAIIIKRHMYDVNEFVEKPVLLDSDTLIQPANPTDVGYRALLRYRQARDKRDLEEAIAHFEHARGNCIAELPIHSEALFILATAKFIHCQDNHHYDDLDVPITIYHDILQFRTGYHSAHRWTALDLCFALLTRLQKQSNHTGKEKVNDLLSGVIESYAYRAVWLALQMAGISVPIKWMKLAISEVSHADDELIRKARILLWDLPDRHPDRPVMLAGLGALLYHRFNGNGRLVDIHEAISLLEYAVQLTPHEHSDKPARLVVLQTSLMSRFERLGDVADINRSVSMLEEAVHLTPTDHPDKLDWFNNLANLFSRRFMRLGDLVDINKSISIFEQTFRLASDNHPDMPLWLNNLGDSLASRFRCLGDLVDIEKSILMLQRAVHLTPNDHPNKPLRLSNLGHSLARRFSRLGNLVDIDQSISTLEEAVHLTPSGHPNMPRSLYKLADSLSRRFEQLGDLADIDRSIQMFEEAVRLTVNNQLDKPALFGSLGSSLSNRFKRLGNLTDFDKSISMFEEAVRLTPNDHPEMPAHLGNLGDSLFHRYERFGDLADIDRSVPMLEEALRITPNGHPDKPARLNSLGTSLAHRFTRLGAVEDIDKSISVFEEAVRLTPDGHPARPGLLSNLGNSFSSRFERLQDLVDINKSVLILEEAVRLTPTSHSDKPSQLNNLGSSLFRRFERLGNPADIHKSILMKEEAVYLTHSSHPEKPVWLNNLGNSLLSRFMHLGDLADVENSVSMFEEAIRLIPSGHPEEPALLSNLGHSLLRRFERLGDLADINRSISVKETALRLTPNDHPHMPACLNHFGASLIGRFEHLDDPADLDKSILTFEQTVRLTPNGHADKPVWLNNLGSSLLRRFERFDSQVDIDRSILMIEEAVYLTPNDHPDKPAWLSNLGNSLQSRFEHFGDPIDIDNSISIFEQSLRLTPKNHPHMPDHLSNLGNALLSRLKHPRDLVDIEKSISILDQSVHLTPHNHPHKPIRLYNLGNAFIKYFKHSRDPTHVSAAISRFSMASRSFTGSASIRFRAARRWVSSARLDSNSCAVLDPYAVAIDLLPQIVWLGLPLIERHRVLLDTADLVRDATAAALEAGFPEQAVEWLEQGRSIVWTQFLQLRTPVDILRVEHPTLADQFQRVSQELEHASYPDKDHAISYPAANQFITSLTSLEDEVQRHHDLALRRERLIAEIRTLPGFDRFLLPKTAEQLAPLAYSGPVIYLNASEQRCDAVIIVPDRKGVIPIPLSGINYQDLEEWQGALRLLLEHTRLISRGDVSAPNLFEDNATSERLRNLLFVGDDTSDFDRAVKIKPQRIADYTADDLLRQVLAYLWREVASPVLRVLGFLALPPASKTIPHIYWCPTGPFTFLPIHAAGIYDTAESGTKLSDFAISSYTPTLSALASSAKRRTNSCSPNIQFFAVPQPPTDGLGTLVCVREEINLISTMSTRTRFVTFQGSHGIVEDVLEKMKSADWVHFACHGVQDPRNPLDSGLCLADGRRLKLSDIIRLSRPQGGLAFLSACQTAQGDEKLAEESVHLAAGMLLAGYGGVIATMWAIRDPDAPQITKAVYEHLFRHGDLKAPDSTEAAEALHYAVRRLRDSGAPFTSWVPFIHVGR